MSEQELKEAVKVLKKESESIDRAAARLGKNFSQALDILSNPENKIIVCGIGKSGKAYQKNILKDVLQKLNCLPKKNGQLGLKF